LSFLVTVCESSKEINGICQNNKYNDLWINKIKKDFNIIYDGKKAYEEYKFLEKLYRKEFYVIVRTDEEEQEFETTIFDRKEKAEKYVYTLLDGKYPYLAMRAALRSEDGLVYGPTYKLVKQHIYNEESPNIDEYFYRDKRESEENEEKLMKLVENQEDVLESINDFTLNFNKKFSRNNFVGNTLMMAKNLINNFVKETGR
jgi:hypothetical protein